MKAALIFFSLAFPAVVFAEGQNLACHLADGSTVDLQLSAPMEDGSTLAILYRTVNGKKDTVAMLAGGTFQRNGKSGEAVDVYLDSGISSGALKLTPQQKDSVTSLDVFLPYQPSNGPAQPSSDGILVLRASAGATPLASGLIHYVETQGDQEQITQVEPCL